MQTQTPNQRKADAKAKRSIARLMLKAGKSNANIIEAVKAKFKTGIGPDVMATIRAELGISGPNRGVKKAKTKKESEMKKKHTFALSLIKKGLKNADIKTKIKAKFGSAVHNSDLAVLRGTRGKRRKVPTDLSVLVIQDNGTSAAFKGALQSVVNQMPSENIHAITVHADGVVRVQQTHEFLVAPQRVS